MAEFETAFREALSKIAEAYRKTGEALRKIEEAAGGGAGVITKEELAGFKKAWREALNAVEEFRKKTARLAQRPGLKNRLEIDEAAAKALAVATVKELSAFGNLNEGTKAYAALLSLVEGGIYGHAASVLLKEGMLTDLLRYTPRTAYRVAGGVARVAGETVHPSHVKKTDETARVAKIGEAARAFLLFITGLDDEMFNRLDDLKIHVTRGEGKIRITIHKAGDEPLAQPLAQLTVEKSNVVHLVGGSLFEELRRRHEEAFGALKNWLAQRKRMPEAREVARLFEKTLKASTPTAGAMHVPQRRVEVMPYGGLQLLLGWLASDVTFHSNYVDTTTT